jgi:hypothetical protein
MARKVSAGIAGGAAVAGLQAFTTTLTSANNLDIVVEPAGTGRFLIRGDAQLQAQGDLRFADSDSSNWVAFQAPATIAANYTLTLPTTDGTGNQVLTTNGSGTLTWSSKDVAIADQVSSSSTHYITLSTATSGLATTLNVSSTKLTFQPSTGLVTATGFVGNHSGGTGAFTTLSASSTVSITATTTARQLNPEATNTYDLGTTALRWRNIFTNDLHLSNGIGDYTIVEGEDDLFLYNNKKGKVYKFALVEVNPADATPKAQQ